MADKNTLDWIALVLVIIGGLNLGLAGIGNLAAINLNVINLILGTIAVLENIVYILIGLAAVYMIYYVTKK